jgi:hypothetical protein
MSSHVPLGRVHRCRQPHGWLQRRRRRESSRRSAANYRGGFEPAVAIAGTMAVADDAEVGAGKYILIPRAPNKQDTSTGNLTFEIELPVDKDVRFWFRTKWGGSCSNSVELTVPGFTPKVIGEDGNYERWHWVKHKGPMLPLKAGTHKIVIAERESDSDLGIDQIVITTIKNFVPVEIEE